jgi:predicted dehydrogenase
MQKARIALVGTGRMGEIRARLMYCNPIVDFTSVVDMNGEKASALADKYSVSDGNCILHEQMNDNCVLTFILIIKAKPFTSLKDAIDFSKIGLDITLKNGNDKGLDAIVLCAPTFAHDEVIREAADHGLSIFVGKIYSSVPMLLFSHFTYQSQFHH